MIDYFIGMWVVLFYLIKGLIKDILDYTELLFFYDFCISKKHRAKSKWIGREIFLEMWLAGTKNPFKRKAYRLLLNEIKKHKEQQNDR